MTNSSPRIAIDCRTVLSPKTGDRTYTLNLLRGLALLPPDQRPAGTGDWQFDLLLDQPAPPGLIPTAAFFREIVIPAPNSRLWTLAAMPRWARANQPSLIHLQYLGAPGLPCPFVTTIHDVVWYVMPETFPARDRRIMNFFMPATVRKAARVITVSHCSEQLILRYLPTSRNKIDVTYNAVDCNHYGSATAPQIATLRDRLGLAQTPYVLSVGVLQPRKNVPRLIEAFVRIKEQHPDWDHLLVIAGKPGWGPDAQLAAGHPDIRFTGYVPDEEMPALYAGATIFAYPSLYEGFGLPVIEAQAAGTPVLASNNSSLPEVTGDAARFVIPSSVESIIQGLEDMLTSADLRETLAAQGLVNARRFTTRAQAESTLLSYRNVLN